MSKLIKEDYIISLSPEAAKVKIDPGKYDCHKTFLEATCHILDRNSGNLLYTMKLPAASGWGIKNVIKF